MDEKKFLENFAKILGSGAQEELDKIEQKRLREEKLLKSFSAALSKTADFEVKLEEDIPQPKEVKLPDEIFKKLPTPEIIESPTVPIEAFVETIDSEDANTIISEVKNDVKPEETANIVSQAASVTTKVEDGKKQEAEIINASLRKEIEIIKKSVADFHKLLQQQSQKIVLAGGSHGGGEVWLERLDDVDYESVRNAMDGQVLTYSEEKLKWTAADPTGGGGGSGARGYTGSRGYAGSIGSNGYTGSQGIGYTGSQGSTGFVGSQGNDGALGFTGSSGEIGYSGSRGLDGYIGADGYTGSQGTVGYTGSSGTAAFDNYGTDGQILVSNGTAANWKSKFYVGNTSVIPVNPLYGDIWFSTDDNKPYMWINTGTYDTWYDFLPV
jgi:hypothetical protein